MLKEYRLWLLVSLKLSGEAGTEELRELDFLIQQNPDLSQQLEVLEALWKKTNEQTVKNIEQAFDKHLLRLNSQVEPINNQQESRQIETNLLESSHVKSAKNYKKLWWLSVAAASILSVWVLLSASNNNEKTSPQSADNIISTKPGFKASVSLPDGSKVWLNGDSKINYNGDFQGKTREVYLSGEAFFDIAKDKTRPFIIHTRTINLKVLGTAFNVRSYDNDKETETALVHGSVEITLRNNPDKKIVLKPGEKLLVKNFPVDSALKVDKFLINEEEQPIAVLTKMHYYGQDSSSVETSWTKNQLVFYNERLDKIALNLERWFKVKVFIKHEDLKKGKYTAKIEEADKLEEVLEALKMAEGFHYSIKNNEVTIWR